MTIQRTISIIKPDAVGKNVIGKIYSRFEDNGLKIVAAKMKHHSTPFIKSVRFFRIWLIL